MADEELAPIDPVDDADAVDIDDRAAGEESETPSWVRRYPPLVSMLGGLLIAVLVMPSALNLPQNPPQQTLEFAPVPPEDSDDPPPPEGNFDNLGLGSSDSLSSDGAPGGDGPGTTTTLPPPIEQGIGEVVSDKRCVEGRQTEDPLAPPCVAFFDGDNFGATYQGVSEDEINILVYIDGNVRDTGTSRGTETRPSRTYFDLVNDQPEPDEHVAVRVLRGWQQYFNTRYQTYGRFVHFHVYFSGSDRSPESRRADAAENFKRVTPFATLNQAGFDGGGDAYLDSMLKRGVLNFGSFVGQSAEFYEKYPTLLWGFLPSLEIQAQQYSDVLCKMYVNRPVAHSGQFNGQPREFGLVYTTDNGFVGLQNFKDTVVERFNACGGTIDPDNIAVFPRAGYAVDNSTTPQYALDAMSKFKTNGVTTIIWPGGYESKFTKAAEQLNYLPEWVLAGDGDLDGEYGNQVNQAQSVWQFAVAVSNQPFVPDDETRRICFQAYRTIDPEAPRQDVNGYACDYYTDLRQLFIGIQVAGPRLGPTSIDKGFHAIPAIRSQDPQVPACFYLPADYTCVKDVVIAQWDPSGRPGGSDPGCWEFILNQRFLREDIPSGNITDFQNGDESCLGYDNGFRLDPNPPDADNL